MNIKTAADLKAAIALLEVDVSVKKTIMTEQYHATCESLKPSNIIRGAVTKVKDNLNEMFTTGDLADKIIGTTLGFGAGVLSKKVLVGKSDNMFKRFLGTILEVAVTGIIAKNSDGIKEKGLRLWRRFTNNHDHQPN